jgi:hypothetical protein
MKIINLFHLIPVVSVSDPKLHRLALNLPSKS